MQRNIDYRAAREMLLQAVSPVPAERVDLERAWGRVLAEDAAAAGDVPPFDRSPYDGYALRSADTARAAKDRPAVLTVLEEVSAGAVPTKTCTPGTAVKILTGAPIPPGADAVIDFEHTRAEGDTVALFAPVGPGENIVRAGEDVRKGEVLLRRGQLVDPGAAGTLAAQGVVRPLVCRRPRVGLISTGNEVSELGAPLAPGKIYDSNRYSLGAAVGALGCECVYLGLAGDDPEAIRALLERGLDTCDAVVSTGGVSVGDYDFTPDAMERAGIQILFRGVDLKPGMACAYGVREGKPVCGLSGNPASSLTNFYAVAAPALKTLAGRGDAVPREFPVALLSPFPKKSKATRLLRGRLEWSGGQAGLRLPRDQGNVVISSAIGCDMMARVPAGSGALEAGTVLEGWLL